MDVDPREFEHVKINDNDVRKIVLSYLVHNCFKETAETFISCTGMQLTPDYSVDIDKRKPIYKHVLEGNVLEAIRLTNQLAADLLQSNKDVYFDLLTLHFVELVRSRDCTGALEFAQKELNQFGKQERYVHRLEVLLPIQKRVVPVHLSSFLPVTQQFRLLECRNYESRVKCIRPFSRGNKAGPELELTAG